MGTKTKIVRCPLHGYITLSKRYFEKFIDTAILQRLREVRQTPIDPVFPSALHSRFAHSLGVYHLADQAFSALMSRTHKDIRESSGLKNYREPFKIAALVHDCGHTPFSHVLEHNYLYGDYAQNHLMGLIQSIDSDFRADYEAQEANGFTAQPHELFSASLFLEFFSNAYTDVAGNTVSPALVARMITGCVHNDPADDRKQVENCLIRLINGPAIDVDKLDYIVRDNWTAAINSYAIDYYRLLSALSIDRHKSQLQTVFNKSALSVIMGVVRGRNFLYRWIFSHHIVTYFQELLQQAVRSLVSALAADEECTESEVISNLFSAKVFGEPVKIGGLKFYLPTDGDLMAAFKYYEVPELLQLLSRRPSHAPLWKSTAEFDVIFKEKVDSQRNRLRALTPEVIEREVGIPVASVITLENKTKLLFPDPKQIFVKIRKEVVPFSDAVPESELPTPVDRCRFYAFIPNDKISQKDACVDSILNTPVP